MPDLTNTQLLPPSNWQDFERLCHSLWKQIWQDPNSQLNGRSGQAQSGVDVFGIPKGAGAYAGVQCKGRDGRYGGDISEDELAAEVEKAKTFEPRLAIFILATTANSDARMQTFARKLTIEHRANGLFDVLVFGWPEIQAELARHPEVIDVHYPQFSDPARRTLAAVSRIEDVQTQTSGALRVKAAEVLAHVRALRDDFRVLVSAQKNDDLDRELAAELDHCRELILSSRPRTALELLSALRDRVGPNTNPSIKFRILTNSGAAKLGLRDEVGAAEDFLGAYACDSASEKAYTNKVLAHLIRGEKELASETATLATLRYPKAPAVWASLIKARLALDCQVAIETVVPRDIEFDENFLLALAHAYGQQLDFSKAEMYLRQVIDRKPSPDTGIALGDCLAEQVSRDGKFYPGAPLTLADRGKLDEAADLLETAWASIKRSEVASFYSTCPTNLSSVLLVLGETLAQCRSWTMRYFTRLIPKTCCVRRCGCCWIAAKSNGRHQPSITSGNRCN